MTSDWQEVRLGEVFEVSNARLGAHETEPTVFALSKYDGFVESSEYFEKRVASKKLDGYKVVRPDDWAYSTIHIDEGSIARNWSGALGVVSPMYTILRWIGTDHEPEYFELLLRSPDMLAVYGDLAQGSINRRRSLPWKTFASIAVTVPSLPTQRRIVDLVNSVDAALGGADAAATASESLLHSYLSSLQSGEVTSLGSLSDVLVGFPFSSSDFSEKGTRLLRGDNVVPGGLRWRDAKHIDEGVLTAREQAYHLHVGDIVVAMDRPVISSGTKISAVVESDLPALLVQRVARIRIADEGERDAAMLALKSPQFRRHLLSVQTGAHVPHINKTNLSDFEIAESLLDPDNLALGRALDAFVSEAKKTSESLRALRANLVASLISGAHKIPESYDELISA